MKKVGVQTPEEDESKATSLADEEGDRGAISRSDQAASIAIGSLLLIAGLVAAMLAYSSYRAGRPGSPELNYKTDNEIGRVDADLPADVGRYYDVTVDYVPVPNESSRMEFTFSRFIGLGIDNYWERILTAPEGSASPPVPVLVLRLWGGARVQPNSMNVQTIPGVIGKAETFPDPDYPDIMQVVVLQLSKLPGAAPQRLPLGENFNLVEYKFTALTVRPVAIKDNARVAAVTPEMSPIGVCEAVAGQGFVTESVAPFTLGGCSFPDDPPKSRLRIPSPSPVRIDFTDQPPLVSGVPEWGPFNFDSYSVSYSNINEESTGAKSLFFSAAWIGVATALVPVGVERVLAGSRKNPRGRASPNRSFRTSYVRSPAAASLTVGHAEDSSMPKPPLRGKRRPKKLKPIMTHSFRRTGRRSDDAQIDRRKSI